MKSKPVYSAIELDLSAQRHVFMTQGRGVDAARHVMNANPMSKAVLLSFDDPADGEAALSQVLTEVGMDTAFYIAGPEVFLWQAARLLREAGIGQRRIQQELAGSQARKVYCVHCRTMNARVTMTVHRCGGCGMALTIRDHFSRPLGAYIGVISDAEMPGQVPEAEMLYA